MEVASSLSGWLLSPSYRGVAELLDSKGVDSTDSWPSRSLPFPVFADGSKGEASSLDIMDVVEPEDRD